MENGAAAEPVRLVVWDLDETFWHGTLTEGGMRYRRDVHDIVVALAGRGIISSICSKNTYADVKAILEPEGIWDYFVFPSINWDAKGPRLAALVDAVQLRAPTVLFIDDNPMNLAEAQHYVPGIQVADEKCIPTLLENPLLRGKSDPGLTRLDQYRILQRRQSDQAASGNDNTAFLRDSGIVVTIEHDIDRHIDRAIELINRTNQLNYTKKRLPENIEEARAELREILASYSNQAGIVRVRDRYGDYGYCGFYITYSGQHVGTAGLRLLQFCFSCRILNMGVETWLYRRLGRPGFRQRGEVLTDIVNDTREIDWISVETSDSSDAVVVKENAVLDYVFARGACDLRAVTHYFGLVANTVYGEFNTVEDGLMIPLHHCEVTRHALNGLPPGARRAFARFGYKPNHFDTQLKNLPNDARGIWLLSFAAEPFYALYKHRRSGLSVPIPYRNPKFHFKNVMELDPAVSGLSERELNFLKENFTFTGLIGEAEFKADVRLMLSYASPGTKIFIVLARNERVRQDGKIVPQRLVAQINQWLAELAAELPSIHLLQIMDFVEAGEETDNPFHFDRKVYYRIYQQIMRLVLAEAMASAAE